MLKKETQCIKIQGVFPNVPKTHYISYLSTTDDFESAANIRVVFKMMCIYIVTVPQSALSLSVKGVNLHTVISAGLLTVFGGAHNSTVSIACLSERTLGLGFFRLIC